MGFDYFIDFAHKTNGFGEGEDDLLIVGEVIFREGAALSVLQPFLADLVTADVEVPYLIAYSLEPSRLCLVNPHCVG